MVTIKFNKNENVISMTRMSVEDDLIERNAQNRFWLSSKRNLQGIILVITIAVIIVGFSVIRHKRSISSQYDNERYHYFLYKSCINKRLPLQSSSTLFRNTTKSKPTTPITMSKNTNTKSKTPTTTNTTSTSTLTSTSTSATNSTTNHDWCNLHNYEVIVQQRLNSSKNIIVVDEIYDNTYKKAKSVCENICGRLCLPSTLKENDEVESVLVDHLKNYGYWTNNVWLRMTYNETAGTWYEFSYTVDPRE